MPLQVTIPKDQIPEITQKVIKDLERQVASLERKLDRERTKNAKLQELHNFSKNRRDEVRNLSQSLLESLDDNKWIDLDRGL